MPDPILPTPTNPTVCTDGLSHFTNGTGKTTGATVGDGVEQTSAGIITGLEDHVHHLFLCDRISDWLGARDDWTVLGVTESPIQGPKGNREFLIAAEHA